MSEKDRGDSKMGTAELDGGEPEGSLRVAIVGAGQMAVHHAHALSQIAAARLTCVVEPDAEVRERFLNQETAARARGWSDLAEALEAEQVRVVHICTPPATHVSLARQALEAGCHVYVEKPFAPTEREALKLLELAERRGTRVCAGHQLLFEAPTRQMLELVPSLAPLAHLESYFAFRPSRGDRGSGLAADEQLNDILPHPLYALLYLLEATQPEDRPELVAVDVAGDGTIHALIRSGGLTGSLVVTLTGRPVESYVKLVGVNGTVSADYVRGIVVRAIGPGSSTIDKVLQPYRTARQLSLRSTTAFCRRLTRRERSYPGLVEIFEAFYGAIRHPGSPAPLSDRHLLDTSRLLEEIAVQMDRTAVAESAVPLPLALGSGEHARPNNERSSPDEARRVVVTGGTGFLGSEVVRQLRVRGAAVRVLARKVPAAWDRETGVEYIPVNLGRDCPPTLLEGFAGVIHCAAETRGGWEAHERNSVHATEQLVRACQAAGVSRVVHVSSLAVLAPPGHDELVSERTGLRPEDRSAGPYVWGKLTSERHALTLSTELGIHVKVARPAAIVDFQAFEPPGRLGRRLGNVFVAVGPRTGRIGIVSRAWAAETLAWMILHFEEAPDKLNVLNPSLPTRRELVERLKERNPGLRVVWLPRPLLGVASAGAVLAQRVLRRGKEPIRLDQAFTSAPHDTSRIRTLQSSIEEFKSLRGSVEA